MRFWGKIIVNDKIKKHLTVTAGENDITNAVAEICKLLDLSVPVFLEKHHSELKNYSRTSFLPADFIESQPASSFSRFELEILPDEDAPKRRSKDPRNVFS